MVCQPQTSVGLPPTNRKVPKAAPATHIRQTSVIGLCHLPKHSALYSESDNYQRRQVFKTPPEKAIP
jgi:hypothetical protein